MATLADLSRLGNASWGQGMDPVTGGFMPDYQADSGSYFQRKPPTKPMMRSPDIGTAPTMQPTLIGQGSPNSGYGSAPGTLGANNGGMPGPGGMLPTGGGMGSQRMGGFGVNEAPGNYTGGMTMGDYLNPMADFARGEGLKGIQSTYAGAGNLLSGPAMKGISDYGSNSAINSAWQPAFNNYMQDKGFNYGVDVNDQTIPFNQNLSLAQLGMQGAGIGANQTNNLANLLSQNLMGGANAGAAGTMGGSNAINDAISQMLQQFMQNQWLNYKPPGTS